MLTEKAKVVTIITVFDAQDLVQTGFTALGVAHFSSFHIEGVGAHGERRSGLSANKNLEYVVLASEALASSLLDWVDRELLPNYSSIAYSTDAVASTARPLR